MGDQFRVAGTGQVGISHGVILEQINIYLYCTIDAGALFQYYSKLNKKVNYEYSEHKKTIA